MQIQPLANLDDDGIRHAPWAVMQTLQRPDVILHFKLHVHFSDRQGQDPRGTQPHSAV